MYNALLFFFIQTFIFCSTAFYSQLGQDKRINEILKGKRNGVFIDIGAHDGIKYSNTYFFEKTLGWTGICIEPHPDIFKKLEKNRSCICINAGISSFDGFDKFLKIVNSNPLDGPDMLSGFIEAYDPRHIQRIEKETQADGSVKEIIVIPCFTLTSVLKQHNLYKIDYISIDVEGSELRILEGINFDLFDIDLIDIENNYGEDKIRKFLERKNFVLYENIGADQLFRNIKNIKK